jgi:beta-lactamase class C
MKNRWPKALTCAAAVQVVLFFTTALAMPASGVAKPPSHSIRAAVDAVIPALMARDHIPGMAVAVTDRGETYVFNYGVASISRRAPVTGDTLFELGSVTKTFTATLASWAQIQHRLSLGDSTANYIPALRDTPFGNVTLLSLGTHTPGGIALQFPADLMNDAQLIRYLAQWRPTYPMGTYRTYSNQGIGMLGFIAAKSMGEDFRSLMQERLFPALGLQHSFIAIPIRERADYAWGYTDDDTPIRMTAGMLSDETYGIRTTAADMIRFVQENIDPSGLPASIREAIVQTHTGYFRAGPMTQDLIWEQYPYPVALSSLLDGNSDRMMFQTVPVKKIVPPQIPMPNAWIDKTGSTNGFAAYVAFVPSKRIGIVLLANKDYPIPDRVIAAYRILSAMAAPFDTLTTGSPCSNAFPVPPELRLPRVMPQGEPVAVERTILAYLSSSQRRSRRIGLRARRSTTRSSEIPAIAIPSAARINSIAMPERALITTKLSARSARMLSACPAKSGCGMGWHVFSSAAARLASTATPSRAENMKRPCQ